MIMLDPVPVVLDSLATINNAYSTNLISVKHARKGFHYSLFFRRNLRSKYGRHSLLTGSYAMAISYNDPKQRGLHSTRWNGVVKGKAACGKASWPRGFGGRARVD